MALAMVAAHYRVAVDPAQLAHELGLGQQAIDADDIVRAAKRVGLRARRLRAVKLARLASAPPACGRRLQDGQFGVIGLRRPDGRLRVGFPWNKSFRDMTPEELQEIWSGELDLDYAPDRRRRDRPGIIWISLVPDLDLALPQAR